MKLKDGLKQFKDLPRSEYVKKNNELSESLWDNENLPTVADIAVFMNGEENENINRVFEFFDNKQEFTDIVFNTTHNYSQEKSYAFIKKVMSANNDDISDAGYFYKKLMAAADDFTIVEDDCNSNGKEVLLENIDEETFNYRIKYSYINEFSEYVDMSYDEFRNKCKDMNLQSIHYRSPMNCAHSLNHCLCKKCAGIIPDNISNIGTFTTLMVTENATQSALSSMNKGVKKNINTMLEEPYRGESNIDSIYDWMNGIVNELTGNIVFARFYEIALLSRIRKDDKNRYFVTSMQSSINYSGNPVGAYIFKQSLKKLQAIVNKKTFDDNSLKFKIAMNGLKGDSK